jgi:hypothetical protein
MMSQNGIDVIPLLVEDGQRAKPARNKPDPSHEEVIFGLDVEPEVAFREGQKQKENHYCPVKIFLTAISAR